jgi:hypothetical protein
MHRTRLRIFACIILGEPYCNIRLRLLTLLPKSVQRRHAIQLSAVRGIQKMSDEFEKTGLEERSVSTNNSRGMFDPACAGDPTPVPGDPERMYALPGRQVEPEAGYWATGPRPLPRVVEIREVWDLTKPGAMFEVKRYPRDRKTLDYEIQELAWLAKKRDDREALVGCFEKDANTERLPISDFIQLDPPPFGTIFNIGSRTQYKIENINQQHLRRQKFQSGILPAVVQTGRQLARMFEIETPGLIHRHALNYLFYKRGEISPPRQARVWMALDVTIYSALVAAWWFKWAADPEKYSYRQRPYEYDLNKNFRVLFDDVVSDSGEWNKCPRACPCPSPGTPRHPAYPSGHSTFSSAASEILKYFFRDADTQTHLDQLSNNIGTARLWAGVHWRSDHTAGVQIGKAVAYLVSKQLERDCIPPIDMNNPCAPNVPGCDPRDTTKPPSHAELKKLAEHRRNMGTCDECDDVLAPQRSTEFDDCSAAGAVQVF